MKIGPYKLVRTDGKNLSDRKHEVLDMNISENNTFVLVAKRPVKGRLRKGPEVGSASTRFRRVIGGEEYNPNLRGQQAFKAYDKMRRTDATVRSTLELAKTPILSGQWFVKSADPNSDQDNEIRDFVEWCLFQGMESGWNQFLTEALTMLDFGYSFFEKVYINAYTPFGLKTIWYEFAPRSIFTVDEWVYDTKGRPSRVEITNFEGKGNIPISYSRLLTFTKNKEANNVEGISILRSAYKPWTYKSGLEMIDGIQKERHGIGIPCIILPPHYNDKDHKLASEIGENLRTNEQAHVVLPPRWELTFLKIEGRPVNPIESIDYHNNEIRKNVLADFLNNRSSEGAKVQSDIFLKGTRHVANIIYEQINLRAIPELVRYNYGSDVTKFPQLQMRKIGDDEGLRVLTFAIRNLIGAGVLVPDEHLENFVRELMDLPPRDKATERDFVINPMQGGPNQQNGASAGVPRQGPPSVSQGQGSGNDSSGTR